MRSSTPSVGVNLAWLVPGVVGGSEEYSVRLLEGLAHRDDPFELRIYGRQDLFDCYPWMAEAFETVVAPVSTRSKGVRIGLEQSWLSLASKDDDVVHHMGGVVPLVRSRPPLVTVHDLQPLDMPANFGSVKRKWLNRMLPYSVRAARLVCCPSRFTADRLVDLLDVPESKIRIVPHGHDVVNDGQRSVVTAESSEMIPEGRFLLYPAIAYRHKRHRDVLELVARLPDRLADVSLVLTGGDGPETEALAVQARELGIEHKVLFTGRVSVETLRELYRRAEALVFPSSYEGFGNPCLEAMRLGCPAIVSDAGALPEVAADAAVVVPVGDIDQWAKAVTKVVETPGVAAGLVERGHKRATEYSVAIASQRLASVYCEALGSS